MDRKKTLACLTAALLLAGCSSATSMSLRVGSKNFTEQILLGEIIAQHVERRFAIPVERSLNLGGTLLAHQALVNGEIDLYPEYTGTAASAILKEEPSSDPAAVLALVQAEYRGRFSVEWLDPLGVNNTFAVVITGARARQGQLRTLSDAARSPRPWILGMGYEFEQRPDGMPALQRTYSLPVDGAPKTMDLGLLYRAIDQDQVTMIVANSTDGLLSSMDLVMLEDDQRVFPPYEASIAVRAAALDRIPGLREALAELSGTLDNSTMQRLNFQVDGRHASVTQVAAGFLDESGL
jgi:glycine betaine/choline ABC-type transport system substrate-binding protein